MQTPQIFNYEILKKAYKIKKISNATDEASLCDGLADQYWVEGDVNNIKLTHPSDLKQIKELIN